jgi:hypothetical protein
VVGAQAGWLETGTALLPIALLAAGARATRGRLSLDYADSLSAIDDSTVGGARRRPARPGLLAAVLPARLLGHEGRAVSLLVRAQFRFDQRFRLAVLGIAPLTLVYLLAGVIMDAERRGTSPLGRPRLYHFAIMLFPVMLQQSLIRSDAYGAAWVYRATPTSAVRLLLSLKNLVFASFVLPYVFVVGMAAWALSGSGRSLALGLATTALASHAFLLGALCMEPRLPFSIPARRPAEGRALMGIMLATAAVGQALAPVLDAMQRSLAAAATVLLVLASVNVALQHALLARVRAAERRGLYDV